MSQQNVRTRERVPTGRRGRPSKSMIAAAMERPFCAYLHKVCLNNRLEGHKYCIDHIMNDKTAPYRQCTFVHSTSGRRCTRAAHKVDRRAAPLCMYHRAIKSNQPPAYHLERLASETKKTPKEALLDDLAHHRPTSSDEPKPQSSNTFWIPYPNGTAAPSRKLGKILASYNVRRLTEDLTPLEMHSTEDIAVRHNNADSDTESVDNDYDRFRNASVFTEEEVLRTLRDKMIRLRRLYIEQYSHIQYVLKEKRLKFIQAQRLEDEIHGPIYSFRNFPNHPDYQRLQAMLRYHKTFGPESLLQDQAKKQKQNRPPSTGPHPHQHFHHRHYHHFHHHHHHSSPEQSSDAAKQPNQAITCETTPAPSIKFEPTTTNSSTNAEPSVTNEDQKSTINPRAEESNQTDKKPPEIPGGQSSADKPPETSSICIFSRTPYGCDKPSIPLSPYCKQHILYDSKQVLFRPCAGGIPPCLTPVVSYTRKNKCWLHTAIN